jgi:hypothetical protein
MILYPYYFNNDSIRPKLVTTAVTFFADLRKISGTGFGFFDNSTDSISVVGFGNWDTMGAVISGDRRLRLINPTSNRMYSTTLTLKGYAGDSTRYSYVCYPGIYFENSGWENIIERYIVFPYSDSTYSLPTVVPNIFPLPLLNINVLFTVQFPDTARNAKNNQLIPRNEIEWVGLKGNIPQIGNWAGNWTPTDTILAEGASYPAMTLLNDKGHNGDIVPGDGVWSTTIVIPTSTGNNLIQYRYAVMYPGADTINRRVTPLDNESTNGQCHQFIFSAPQNGSNMVRSNIWGQMEYPDPNGLSDIKRSSFAFRLDQNFPNPFNPSTKIGFMIPEECHVTIKVYNMIGKEVSTLVDRQMRASSYETDFNARSLSSGLYFYKLSAGSYTAVKKMMFVK